MATRFHIYSRLSVNRQGPLSSTVIQEQLCKEWVGFWGGTVVGTYREPGKSAHEGRTVRPKFQALMDEVRLGHVEAILVWRMDRLARSPREYEALVRVCQRNGTEIFSVVENVNTSTPTGVNTGRLWVLIGQIENDSKNNRIDGLERERARLGKPPHRGIYGLDASCTGIVESEAALIREAAERLLSGEGPTAIARDWAARGLVTRTGKPFSVLSLRTIMVNPGLVGDRVYRGELVAEGIYPATLDRATAARVRARLAGGVRTTRVDVQPRGCLLGLASCGTCHSRLGLVMRRGVLAYGCRDRSCANRPSIDQPMLEAWAQDATAARLRARRGGGRRVWNQEAVAASVQALNSCTDALHAVNRAYFLDAHITRSEWLRTRDLLLLTQAQRVARIGVRRPDGLPGNVSLPKVGQAWDRLDNHTKRAVIALEVGRIYVYPKPTHEQEAAGSERVRADWLLPDPPGWPFDAPAPPRRPQQWTDTSSRARASQWIPSAKELEERGGPYSRAEVARLLDCTHSAVQYLTRKGILIADRSGSRIQFPAEGVERARAHYRSRRRLPDRGTPEYRAEVNRLARERGHRLRTERRACYTMQELASRLRVSPKTLRRAAVNGEVPAIRVGSRWRFPIGQVERWIEDSCGGREVATEERPELATKQRRGIATEEGRAAPVTPTNTDTDYTVADVARLLRMDQATVTRLAQLGEIPAREQAGQWRFPIAQLDHWLTDQDAADEKMRDQDEVSGF